jgi:hypothetical protein
MPSATLPLPPADLIAGVDGSALHLSMFMRPGTRMQALRTKRRRTTHVMNALMEVEAISLPAHGAKAGLLGRILNMIGR